MKIPILNQQGGTTELEIFPLKYESQYVLTTRQLSAIVDCSRQHISTNFRRHVEEFIEGEDFFFIQGITLKNFIACYAGMSAKPRWRDKNPKGFWSAVSPQAHELYLWTLTGALKHSQYLNMSDLCDDTLLAYFSNQKLSSNPPPLSVMPVQPDVLHVTQLTPDDNQIELMMKLIDMVESGDENTLRNRLIKATASLILGRQI